MESVPACPSCGRPLRNVNALRQCAMCGSALSPELLAQWEAAQPRIRQEVAKELERLHSPGAQAGAQTTAGGSGPTDPYHEGMSSVMAGLAAMLLPYLPIPSIEFPGGKVRVLYWLFCLTLVGGGIARMRDRK